MRRSNLRLDKQEILEVLKRYCNTPQISEEAKRILAENGCKVLGYNCSALVR
ncbi:MAG: hypothetical protein ACETWE_07940 [Candidatus Bathyarchaeia archaeon]|nr:hypothetical protein [Candidatus Bathyarchaeota archaeon]